MRKGGAKAARGALRVAQVGAFRPFSEEDRTRWVVAMARVLTYEGDFGRGGPRHSVFNLKYGEDFLADEGLYEMVVLHSVLHPICEVTTDLCKELRKIQDGVAMVSPLHTLEKWRERLRLTNAKWIVACGGLPSSLDGWQLREMDGYKIVERNGMVTLYRRSW